MSSPLLGGKHADADYKFVLGKADEFHQQQVNALALEGYEPILITANNTQVVVLMKKILTKQ